MYMTKITSQGTITLPAELRRKYGLETGQVLTIEDLDTLVIHKVPSIEDVRTQNKKYLKKSAKARVGSYKQGDGMTAYLHEKHGR